MKRLVIVYCRPSIKKIIVIQEAIKAFKNINKRVNALSNMKGVAEGSWKKAIKAATCR